jgi:hypothetical protein
MAIPEPVAGSELVSRLKLLAFGVAGYRDDFQAVAAKLSQK